MGIFKTDYRTYSDEALMASVQKGRAAAFDELYARYSSRLLRYLLRMLRDDDRAQDFLQEIFLRIVENPDAYRPIQKFSSWIFTIAHNLCKNEYRRQEVRHMVSPHENPEALATEESDALSAETAVEWSEFEQALWLALDTLSADHRAVFVLRHQQDLSIREIADILNCAEGTVKSRLHYAHQQLAHKLRAFRPDPSERY